MDCKTARKNIHRALDNELETVLRDGLSGHVAVCAACQAEFGRLRRLSQILKSSPSEIMPSNSFDARFWMKVSQREKEPWFIRWLRDFEFFLPTPGFSQALAVLIIALLTGGTAGVVSSMNAANPSWEAKRASVRYLSGFSEFKGVPTSSVAATYLKTIEERKRV